MTRKIIIRPEAENDLSFAYDWYDKQQAGLGRDFILEFSACMDRISDSPHLYSELYRGIRRALVRRYPYGIYYVVTGNDINVLAVIHLAMQPVRWKKRS